MFADNKIYDMRYIPLDRGQGIPIKQLKTS